MGPCYLSLVLFFLLKRELANPRKGMQKCSSSEEAGQVRAEGAGTGQETQRGTNISLVSISGLGLR